MIHLFLMWALAIALLVVYQHIGAFIDWLKKENNDGQDED